jgi:cell wall-associated NlpC family hydrolase
VLVPGALVVALVVCLTLSVAAVLGTTPGLVLAAPGLVAAGPLDSAGSAGGGAAGSAAVGATAPSPAADVAVAWALARVGTPYRWGGTGPGGFDCSGLTQAAFAAAGVRLPRVAQDQYDAGPLLPTGGPVRRGDLVFFGTSAHDVTHVGLAVGGGDMVDAPHSGASVRVEAIWSAGYVGATRPVG